MEILVLADAHGRPPSFEKIDRDSFDLVLFTGDLTNGNRQPHRLERYMGKLSPLAPFYYIPGNDDQPIFVEQDYTEMGMVNVHQKWQIIPTNPEISLLAFGGATQGLINYIAFTEEEMAEKFVELFQASDFNESTVNILMTHDPPRDSGLDKTFGGDHVGSSTVRAIILEKSPLLAVCGHIHEARGFTTLGNTVVVNPGASKLGQAATISIQTQGIEDVPPKERPSRVQVNLIDL